MSPFRFSVALFVACFSMHGVWAATDPCNAALSRFDYPAAIDAAHLALKANPSEGDQLICLGRAEYESGDFRTALTRFNEASQTTLSPPQSVLLQNWFGVTLRRLGRMQEAWQAQQSGLKLARQLNDTPGLATALHNTAGMLFDQGYVVQAIQTYHASLAINPDAAERSASHNNVGLIFQKLGDRDSAERELNEAIRINREGGHFHHLGKHLMNLGNLRRLQARYAEARALINEGLLLEEKAGDRYWLAVAHRYMGWLARDQRIFPLALVELQKARELYLEAGTPLEADQTDAELTQLNESD